MFEHINRNKAYVMQVQKEIGVPVDGIAGPQTLKALKEFYGCEVICHNGKFVPLHNSYDYVVEHDLSLYELPDGTRNWCYRSQPAETICLHWGGHTARNLYRIFYNTKSRHVSTHFAIGRDPRDNNRVEVMQFLDTALQSYHAGKFNKFSVGIDVCQSVEAKHINTALENGHDVSVIDNPGRGPDQMISLDPELAAVAKNFIADLRRAMEIEHKPICKDEEVYGIYDAAEFSIVSHLNVSKRKWDITGEWAKHLHWDIEDNSGNA